MIADLAVRGLASLDDPVELTTHPRSGFPVITIGKRITAPEVADAVDDE